MFPYQTLNGSTQNKPHGIVIHETANPNSTIENEIDYMDRNWRNAFVHAFVDQSKIIEIHDPSYGAWGAGREANKYFMHIELVEHPNDRTAFMKSVLNDAYYAATKLYQFGLTPSRPSKKKGDISGTIWSHNEVSAYLGGTDHSDPTGYFSKFGYSMEQFYELIQYEFEGLGVMTPSGEFVKENGWNLLKSGQWIFIENKKLVEGWKKIDGLYYYFDATGIMQKDWHKEGSYKYYLSSKGSMVTGWSLIKDYWYYFNQSGEMQQGWSKQNNIWYYLLPGGEMAKGWQLIENHWYYFNQSGEMQQGWSKQNNIWYYLLSNGKMATSWQLIGSHWYYFSQLGEMQQGWNKQNNIWYYLLPDGRMATEWHLIGNKWYYLSAGGAMATSWQLIDNTWYYFDVLGHMLKDWVEISKQWYFFDSKGVYVDNYKTKFISQNILDVITITNKYNLFPSIMLAQSILETGYGTSELAKNANNFFGMKFKHGEDESKYSIYFIDTKEYDKDNDETVVVKEAFRKYENKLNSFKDNALKLRDGVSWDKERYKGTWRENASDYKKASEALTGKYATDPLYYKKLNSLVEKWKLNQFD